MKALKEDDSIENKEKGMDVRNSPYIVVKEMIFFYM